MFWTGKPSFGAPFNLYLFCAHISTQAQGPLQARERRIHREETHLQRLYRAVPAARSPTPHFPNISWEIGEACLPQHPLPPKGTSWPGSTVLCFTQETQESGIVLPRHRQRPVDSMGPRVSTSLGNPPSTSTVTIRWLSPSSSFYC